MSELTKGKQIAEDVKDKMQSVAAPTTTIPTTTAKPE